MTPQELLASARDLVERPTAETAGLWPRAAALAARRALEESLAEVWARRAPGMRQASARAQLLCLPAYLNDRDLARDVAYAWASLSEVCHARAYGTGPTALELDALFGVVDRLLARLA